MSQVYTWPPTGSGGSSANASVGPNGAPIPTSATLVAGENPSLNLQPLQTDASGNLLVNIATEPGTPLNVNVSDWGGVATTLGQKVMAASVPVVLASDQSTIPISAASLPLPAGASTSALQTSGNTSLTSILGNQTNGTQITQVSNFPATQPVSGTVTANQGTPAAAASRWPVQLTDGTNLSSVSAAGALKVDGSAVTQPVSGTVAVSNFPATQPVSGTVTANQGTSPWVDNLTQVGGSSISLGQKASAASLPVVLASDQSSIPVASTPVTPAPLAITQAAITVGTTAVRLTVSGSAPASDRVTLVATPDQSSTAKFYIGSSSVTSSGATRGAQISAGQTFIANNDAGDYWIVSDTAAQTVELMEQS
jgi:hypothetical protein